MLSGLAVGWTVHNGISSLVAGVALLLLFAFAMSWVGVWLGPVGADRRGRPAGHLHRDLPDHLRLERVRAARVPAGLAAAGRRVEPGEHPDVVAARAVGQPQPVQGTSLASTEPILVTLIWVVVIVAVFAPLGVRRYRYMSR